MINFDLIFRYLLLGSCPKHPVDLERLQHSAKTTAVLNLQTDDDFEQWSVNWPALEAYYAQADKLHLERVPIVDWHEGDLEKRLITAATTLNDLVSANHRVYVHCTAGVGRAPATVIAWLAWYQDYSIDEAVQFVRSRRQCDPYVDAIRRADAVFRNSSAPTSG